MLKLIETDNGNCRVYYKKDKNLYCFQEDSRDKFTFYRCSLDGEPSYEVKFTSQIDGLPQDDQTTSKNFRSWFEKTHAWETWPPKRHPITTEALDIAQFGRVLHNRPKP